jgi:hypothetical protein
MGMLPYVAEQVYVEGVAVSSSITNLQNVIQTQWGERETFWVRGWLLAFALPASMLSATYVVLFWRRCEPGELMAASAFAVPVMFLLLLLLEVPLQFSIALILPSIVAAAASFRGLKKWTDLLRLSLLNLLLAVPLYLFIQVSLWENWWLRWTSTVAILSPVSDLPNSEYLFASFAFAALLSVFGGVALGVWTLVKLRPV